MRATNSWITQHHDLGYPGNVRACNAWLSPRPPGVLRELKVLQEAFFKLLNDSFAPGPSPSANDHYELRVRVNATFHG